jgi:geranylgeranyl pyrophosphate synthase
MTGGAAAFKAAYMPAYGEHLEACEALLASVSGQGGGLLASACTETLIAGGKRLRPLLVFLCTRRGEPIGAKQHAAAAAVELVHMATLVHDDVLDGADLRRGKPTLLARHGAGMSAAAGDYLFASAFRLLAGTGSTQAVSLLAEASLELSRGELLQMRQAYNYDLGREDYEERCRLKTGSLFQCACRLGALFSGCSEATAEALADYARLLGLAFQITDDVLDFAGERAQTGKSVGTDLLDGTVTLPLILARGVDPELDKLLRSSAGDRADIVPDVCRRLRETGGLDAAGLEAKACADLAAAALSGSAEIDAAPLVMISGMAADRKV